MSDRSNPFAFLSRRRFLAAVAGVGVAATGAGGGLLALRGRAETVEGLQVLDAHGFRTLKAIAEVHLPAGEIFARGAGAELVHAFDAFLVDEPPEVVRDLSRALVLLEYGPVLYDGRLETLSNLSAEDRLIHWQGWMYAEDDLRRQVAVALKKFLTLVFFDQPAVWPHIGYPGPSFHGMPE